MERLDIEGAVRVGNAVSDMREALFLLAEDAGCLAVHRHRQTELHTFLQRANHSLAEAQRELTDLAAARPERAVSGLAA